VNRFNLQSDQNKLNAETIYVNVCGKYRDMNVMVSRTLLVNPEDSQRKAYQLANETLDVLVKNLQVGQPIKSAYLAARDFIRGKDATLGGKIHTNFGFGVSEFPYHLSLIFIRSAATSRKTPLSSMRPMRPWFSPTCVSTFVSH
jgi:nucleosome binding factor SPN SPT16 subunit